jgi:ABC-type nitrate/sulfonate/bicarbonate transport system permease component
MNSAWQIMRPLWGCLAIALTWLLVADIGHLVSPLLIPPLHEVLLRLLELGRHDTLALDTASTLWRFALGFGLGVALGVVSGLFFGVFQKLYSAFELPLEFLRAMPVTALFPLFLILFGIGDQAKVAMAFLPTFLLLSVSTAAGVRQADHARRRMARVFGATPVQIFRCIVLYDALPNICTGVRLGLSLSLIVTVVSEMFIGTDSGLGQRVYDSYLTNSVSTLYALLLVLGVAGYTLNKIAVSLERRFVFWTGR